jgi:hypothetical protein
MGRPSIGLGVWRRVRIAGDALSKTGHGRGGKLMLGAELTYEEEGVEIITTHSDDSVVCKRCPCALEIPETKPNQLSSLPLLDALAG